MIELNAGPVLATAIEFTILALEVVALGWVVVDLFRRREMSGGIKGLWLVALLIVPLIAVLVYVMTRIFIPEIATRNDISSFRKTLWLAFFLLLTPIALFVHLRARGRARRAPEADSAGQEGAD